MHRFHRYDACPHHGCVSNVTHVLVYGCLNGHIHEAYGCEPHVLWYQSTLYKYHCGKCNLPWHNDDSILQELWPVNYAI